PHDRLVVAALLAACHRALRRRDAFLILAHRHLARVDAKRRELHAVRRPLVLLAEVAPHHELARGHRQELARRSHGSDEEHREAYASSHGIIERVPKEASESRAAEWIFWQEQSIV